MSTYNGEYLFTEFELVDRRRISIDELHSIMATCGKDVVYCRNYDIFTYVDNPYIRYNKALRCYTYNPCNDYAKRQNLISQGGVS